MNRSEKIAFLRSELEKLTGKMVSLRDRKTFQNSQRLIKKRRRDRIKLAKTQADALAVLHDE